MSSLNDVALTPALLCLAITLGCAGVAVVVIYKVLWAAPYKGIDFRRDGRTTWVAGVIAAVCGVACVGLLITAAGVSQKHSDDHCHALGGVLDSGGDHGCVKPNSFIDNY